MSKVMSLLAMANAFLRGDAVAKAQSEEPDNLNEDSRVDGTSPNPQDLQNARTEAQSGQQAGQQGGAELPGTPNAADAAPETQGGDKGSERGEDEEEVSKAQILESMRFLAKSKGITPSEIAKAFSGLEGEPAESLHPVGEGEKYLESIVMGMNEQGKILEAIAASIADMAKETVHLKGEVAKAFNETSQARSETVAALAKINNLPRTAEAKEPKAFIAGEPFAKAAAPNISGEDLFQLALQGKMSPTEVANANRRLHYQKAV